jgi:16S rRNA (guanine(966)-N(2))-methyltransferase RsmD
MRIISGTHKGRIVHAPTKLPVRPTTDFAKESIFNILNNHFDFEGLVILDLFSGTGNITYEFASRGSKSITSVDDNHNCCDFVKKTIANFKMENIRMYKSDVFSFLKKEEQVYDIIFADPPYEMDSEKFQSLPEFVFNKNMLKENGWLIIEHGERTIFKDHKHFVEHRKYGNVNFSIFK